MNNQLKKGILEMAILGFLKQEEMYGYTLIQKLIKYIAVKESSVYIILTRLAQNGYLITREEKKGNKKLKYYSLSEEGATYLQELYKQWDEISELVKVSKKEN